MRKKYLIKQPSSQAHLHPQYSSLLNNTHKPEPKARGSHNQASRGQLHRMKTEPTNHDPSPKGLKKRQNSVGVIHKRRYIIPNNKQNYRLDKSPSNNRFTYNEYRASQFTDNSRNHLDMTLNNNRYSQFKCVKKKSMQKINKLQKFKLCSPKNGNPGSTLGLQKMAATQESFEHTHLRSFIGKIHQENAQEQLFPSQVKLEDLTFQQQIGSGTFGKVYCARIKANGQKVAVKRVQQDKKYKTRQLQIVKMLDSPYVVKVLGTFTTDERRHEYLNIIMQTFESNFFQLLKMHSAPAPLDLKTYTYQMLRGLLYIHNLGVCHRDLKPQNMLVKNRRLVICDFGSAKILKPGQQNVSYICSRCYRAPELIFESTNYTSKIDMWSLGCIFLEILNGRPLFIADSSLNHILQVIKVLGTPTRSDVRDMNPSYEINDYDLPQIKKKSFKNMFPLADPLFLDLTEKLVKYSPEKRLSAAEALAHPFFDELRDEKYYKNHGRLSGLDYFFNFQQEVLPIGVRQKLVPKWYYSH